MTPSVRPFVRCALFVSMLCLCAWISLSLGPLRFSAQTLGLFLSLGLLGGKWGSVCATVYLLLGAAGLPVFSGFQGGIGTLLGPTGGFLWSFPLGALVYWALTARFGELPPVRRISMVIVQAVISLSGWLWYALAYLDKSFLLAAGQILLPYLIPDALKLVFSLSLTEKLRHHLR